MPGYFFYGFNYSYIWIILPAFLIAMWAQFNVQNTFNRYNTRLNSRGLTGAQAARQILDANGLGSVAVEQIPGKLNDHYDPKANVIRLSSPVYSGISVAAVGVAAHESGHALQQSIHYAPLSIRNAIIPVTKVGSTLAVPMVIIGLLLSWPGGVLIGIVLFSLAVLFQLITLPVEFNASARALHTLDANGMLYGDELAGARKVLHAAALTYVAATFVALANLLRYVLLFTGMQRRN
ncbi:MAG: zinc metallopeptidase [Clostridia bacterium]|nr:zinc metallopeptidase [Clostridia bacterium]MDR3645153.1 zinc metallopeptidase [Clostridia bacterium]